MLRVNLRDGTTLSFDLLEPAGRAEWARALSQSSFHDNVTGIAVLRKRELHTLPLPRLCRRVTWGAALIVGGIEVSVQADETRAVLTVYNNGPVTTRTDVHRIGKMRFTPQPR